MLGKIYADKSKVKGVDQDPKTNEEIYQRYLKAFKKGVFNYIKEDVDRYTHEAIPRKYFSGGFENELPQVLDVRTAANPPSSAMIVDAAGEAKRIKDVQVVIEELNNMEGSKAMTSSEWKKIKNRLEFYWGLLSHDTGFDYIKVVNKIIADPLLSDYVPWDERSRVKDLDQTYDFRQARRVLNRTQKKFYSGQKETGATTAQPSLPGFRLKRPSTSSAMEPKRRPDSYTIAQLYKFYRDLKKDELTPDEYNAFTALINRLTRMTDEEYNAMSLEQKWALVRTVALDNNVAPDKFVALIKEKVIPFMRQYDPKGALARLQPKKDQAMSTPQDRAALAKYGGIDFNAANLSLQIKRDGRGVPLPISQQDLENININGLVPIIIDIRPATSLPIPSELQNTV